MKRKITGAILISLSLGILWQALAQGLPKVIHCLPNEYAAGHTKGVGGIALCDNSPPLGKRF